MKNSIFPCLWFDGNALEAASFYCSVFDNTHIIDENSLTVIFESSGQKFMCLNGGPEFKFNPSVSFYVICEAEAELDRVWNQLLKTGTVLMPLDKYEWSNKYGWLQDKYGVSWQLALGKLQDTGQKICPVLMFTGARNGLAEKALNFYTSIFENSGILEVWRYTKEDPDKEGNIKHARFSMNNQIFMAMESSLNHKFDFNEAISFVINCDTQEEIDYYWDKLTLGGEESQCGWLKDQFGISWQVVPSVLGQLMSDPSRSQRVVDAFMKMKKFDIEKLVTA